MTEEKIKSKPTIAILTNFAELHPGYSLTGIVVDQALMLAREGHKVILYVNENYNPKWENDSGFKDVKRNYPELVEIKKLTKFMNLIDYEKRGDITAEHVMASNQAGVIFANEFRENDVEIVFAHDFIFTGWNLPYSLAIKRTDKLLKEFCHDVFWKHWIHSVPSVRRDWWDLNEYGDNHNLVYPNKTEIMRVVESFHTNYSRAHIIPHIVDIRTWYEFGPDAMGFTETYQDIVTSNVIQVYPCSTDRLEAKQLDIVIKIFGYMKSEGNMDVFLCAANQWATGRQRKEDVKEYIELAESVGLVYGEDFVFTSEYKEEFETGIPKRMLRELQLLSNVFVFPTREESFGLVGPEAVFSGALPIINKSLTMQFEIMSHHALAFDFGSFHQAAPVIEDENYFKSLAMAILQRLHMNEAAMTKIYCRKRYNMDYIYSRYYLPTFF